MSLAGYPPAMIYSTRATRCALELSTQDAEFDAQGLIIVPLAATAPAQLTR
jgi:hypothetical protein